MTENLMKYSKAKLIDMINIRDMNFKDLRYKNSVLSDTIGSLQEQNELLHQDLVVQIHWRMKLEEELINFGQKTQEQ